MKRRSSGKQQPEPLTFFIDRCLGKKDVAQAMRDAGHHVEIHDDHFSQDEQDHIWLPQVGAKGWIVLTNDSRIKKRAIEIRALHDSKVAAFILTSQDLPGRLMAEAFTKGLRKIERIVAKQSRPFVATVSRNGDVQLVEYTLKDLD